MRKYISENIKDCYFLCADMWNFEFKHKSVKKIDTLLCESTLLNIATGLSLLNTNIYIYGVAGFIIHKYEPLKYSLLDTIRKTNSTLTFLNAGKIGYNDYYHQLHDDIDLMKINNIPTFSPYTIQELKNILENKEQIKYIQLWKDF